MPNTLQYSDIKYDILARIIWKKQSEGFNLINMKIILNHLKKYGHYLLIYYLFTYLIFRVVVTLIRSKKTQSVWITNCRQLWGGMYGLWIPANVVYMLLWQIYFYMKQYFKLHSHHWYILIWFFICSKYILFLLTQLMDTESNLMPKNIVNFFT
jgi:hypothetical protein